MLVQANIATLLTILGIATISTAHSPAWPTIAYTETLGPLHHEILPRHLNNNYNNINNLPSTPFTKRGDPSSPTAINTLIEQKDKIRLRFQAFNKTFYLHLEPNNDLLHPDLFSSSSSSSRLASSSSVYDDIKPFKGVVVEDDHFSNQKWERAMSINQAEEQRSTVEQQLYEEGVLGWARMMIEHDEENEDDTYHITSRQHYHVQKRSDDHSPSSAISSQLIIYRDSDLRKPTKKLNNESWSGAGAGAGGEAHGYYYPPDLTAPIPMGGGTGPSGFFNMASTTFRKRSTTEGNIMVKVAGPNPVPTGCPTTRMINYMGVAADCTYVRSYGGLSNARKQIFADFNTASGIYESTFNIALGIIAVEIESMNCPKTPVKGKAWNQECSTQYTINDRLSDFSYWRGTRPKDGAGLWHLMTQCSSGPIVGIAWTGALCQMSAQSQGGTQYTAGTGVSSISPNEWMVVAHEVGHGFGANHDCTSNNCASPSAIAAAACCPYSTSNCDAGNRFIMNPSEQSVKSTFSPCSIHAICTTISSKAGSCLQPITAAGTKPFQSTQANVCGNGIREKGEQCDCGSAAECALDPCCDGATCKFKGASVCDDMNDDCCRNCQLAPKGLVCRSAVSNCDIAETCSGSTALCPDDVQVPNLSPCDILGAGNTTLGKGQCADGLCTSRDLQCAQQQRPGIDKQCAGGMDQCELLCNDPQGNANSCMKIPGLFFVDGSPCGSSSGGICVSGKCELPGGWVKNHLSIFIPIICLVVVLIGAGIGTYIFLSRRKARRSLKARLSAHALPTLPP
ncbi:MAG: Metallo-peptidase family M12-domain-containing protein, partial [Linnemannia gamsii]